MKLDFPTTLGLVTVSILCIFAVSIGVFGHDILSIEEISYHSEIWLIESEYSFTISDIWVENSLSKLSNSWNEKFYVIGIESFSDYLENLPYPSERVYGSDSPENKFIVHINGSWKDHHDLIKETFEKIDGVKNAYNIGGSVG